MIRHDFTKFYQQNNGSLPQNQIPPTNMDIVRKIMEISATKMNKQRLDALTNSDTDREMGSAKPCKTHYTILLGKRTSSCGPCWCSKLARSLARCLMKYKTFHPRTIWPSAAIVHLGTARQSHQRPPFEVGESSKLSKPNTSPNKKNVPFSKTSVSMENGPFRWFTHYTYLKMVIFYSYVSILEGNCLWVGHMFIEVAISSTSTIKNNYPWTNYAPIRLCKYKLLLRWMC